MRKRDIQPARMYIKRTVRHKFVLKSSLQIVNPDRQPFLIAPLPETVIPKGMASESLLADILINKYIYHLPFYQNSKLSYASTDNHLGGELAARCLMEAGYTRILSIQGNPLSMPNRMRFQGFSETLAKNPEIVHTVVGNSFSCENGYNSVMEMLGGGKKMDAIFTYSVTILQGALHALRELGYRIPEDIG
ncbi:MAG: substrate-binding domain-containing protein, partial [Bacteroidales bacterium]|nr:substrate-binding domain-containing protein [Bacteroidales bacterium]